MKLLLDECVVHGLRPLLRGHDAFTAKYMGWTGIGNGRLLRLAADAGFDAVITTDKDMLEEHHEPDLPLPVIILDAGGVDLESLRRVVPLLLDRLTSPLQRGFHVIASPTSG